MCRTWPFSTKLAVCFIPFFVKSVGCHGERTWFIVDERTRTLVHLSIDACSFDQKENVKNKTHYHFFLIWLGITKMLSFNSMHGSFLHFLDFFNNRPWTSNKCNAKSYNFTSHLFVFANNAQTLLALLTIGFYLVLGLVNVMTHSSIPFNPFFQLK